MKELQTWIAFDAHPYDASTAKVREGAHAPQRHLEGAVPAGHDVGCGRQAFDVALSHIAEELHGQMQLVGVHPRQVGFGDAEWRQRVIERASQRIVELKGEEQAHPHRLDRR